MIMFMKKGSILKTIVGRVHTLSTAKDDDWVAREGECDTRLDEHD